MWLWAIPSSLTSSISSDLVAAERDDDETWSTPSSRLPPFPSSEKTAAGLFSSSFLSSILLSLSVASLLSLAIGYESKTNGRTYSGIYSAIESNMSVSRVKGMKEWRDGRRCEVEGEEVRECMSDDCERCCGWDVCWIEDRDKDDEEEQVRTDEEADADAEDEDEDVEEDVDGNGDAWV